MQKDESGIIIKLILYNKEEDKYLLSQTKENSGFDNFGGHHKKLENICECPDREHNEELGSILPKKIKVVYVDSFPKEKVSSFQVHYLLMSTNLTPETVSLSDEHHSCSLIDPYNLTKEMFRFPDLYDTHLMATDLLPNLDKVEAKELSICDLVPAKYEITENCKSCSNNSYK